MGNHKVLKTSVAIVRYSMYDFIEFVRQEDVLWDHKSGQFHNRDHREKGWRRVARNLYKDFDALQHKDRRTIIDTLMKRWKNARDSFLRAHRLKQSDNGPNYIYDKQMEFLLECGFRRDSTEAQPAKDSSTASTTATTTTTATAAAVEKPNRSTKTRRNNNSRAKVGRKRQSTAAAATAAAMPAKRTRRSSVISAAQLCAELDEPQRDSSSDEDADDLQRRSTPASTASPASVNKDTVLAAILQTGDTLPTKEDVDELAGHSGAHNAKHSDGGALYCQPYNASGTVGGGGLPEQDPDQAFFDSIKPVIRAMSVDKKLDFQIALLKLLKNFRSN